MGKTMVVGGHFHSFSHSFSIDHSFNFNSFLAMVLLIYIHPLTNLPFYWLRFDLKDHRWCVMGMKMGQFVYNLSIV